MGIDIFDIFVKNLNQKDTWTAWIKSCSTGSKTRTKIRKFTMNSKTNRRTVTTGKATATTTRTTRTWTITSTTYKTISSSQPRQIKNRSQPQGVQRQKWQEKTVHPRRLDRVLNGPLR